MVIKTKIFMVLCGCLCLTALNTGSDYAFCESQLAAGKQIVAPIRYGGQITDLKK